MLTTRSDYECTSELQLNRQSRLPLALLVSSLLHGGLLIAMIWPGAQSGRQPRMQSTPPASLVITLRTSSIPLQSNDLEQGVRESLSAMHSEAVIEDAGHNQEPDRIARVDEPVRTPVPVDGHTDSTHRRSEVPIPPRSGNGPETLRAPQAPSVLALRQAVRDLTTSQSNRPVGTDCTAAQSRSKLLECNGIAEPEAEFTLRARVPLKFIQVDPVDEQGQTRRIMATVARNRQTLQRGIEAAVIDSVGENFLKQELNQAIEVYANTGNTPLLRMEQQIYRNDVTYQQARRILNPR